MNITKVGIRPVEMGKVKAIASITIDDVFVVHDLRVVEGERGFFVAMPSKKLPNGEHRDVAHPINSETRETIQSLVLDEYEKLGNQPVAAAREEEAVAEEESAAEEEMTEEAIASGEAEGE